MTSEQKLAEMRALDELELLIREYDPRQSDWRFRMSVMMELIVRIRPAALRASAEPSASVQSRISLSEEFVDGKPDWRVIRTYPEQRTVLSCHGTDRKSAEDAYKAAISATPSPLMQAAGKAAPQASAESASDTIFEAWSVLAGYGFPPEACEYLPAAIENAITALIGAREDLLVEVTKLRELHEPQPSRIDAAAEPTREEMRRLVDWTMLYATEGEQWPDSKTISDPLILLAAQDPTQDDADKFKAGATLKQLLAGRLALSKPRGEPAREGGEDVAGSRAQLEAE